MSAALTAFVSRELKAPLNDAIRAATERLARSRGCVAVLFYGSNLRTGDLDGVLDFYVLTDAPRAWHAAVTGWLWPTVSFRELKVGNRVLRAKVATMPIDTFEKATVGAMLDTTVWARFAQPTALAWVRNPAMEARIVEAVSSAATTAARFAAVVGPAQGSASDFWQALFRETYRAEFRVEPPGREAQILANYPGRYAALLPIAWSAGGVAFHSRDATFDPRLTDEDYRYFARAWLIRARIGKALNLVRLVKAAFSFEGAARYGLWKIERHTGLSVPLTPWRERHPLLAAPEVLWRVFRATSR
jgi:hypothetical protein